MLVNMSIKKIMVATISLLILFVIYLLPGHNDNDIILDNRVDNYEYDNLKETIYLLDKDDYVARTSIKVDEEEIIKKANDLISSLTIEGIHSDIIPSGFRSIIPSGTKVLDIEFSDNNMRINFSKELLDITEEYEEPMIEALIYTLTSLEEVDNITILVEGKPLTALPNSKKKLNLVLDKSYGINKEYDLYSAANIDKTTTYYVNKFNDTTYYVPVTKYFNKNNKDKIEMIIEQLSSSYHYQSNLMSFLNSNTKLLDYKIMEDKISLDFNNLILNDDVSGNILEEVVYTICLSLADEYQVKEVIFYVSGEKVLEISLNSLD